MSKPRLIVDAKKRPVSLSEIAAMRGAPLLRSLRGSLKKADLADYREHLALKYR
jgi:hypothetical protein